MGRSSERELSALGSVKRTIQGGPVQLEETIVDVRRKLREGRFPNEQSISQGIVLRVLSELGWDVYDTNVVWPEFSTGEGRVDFALCDPPGNAKCFVEVKQQGRAEEGVKQALEYAFHTGVQFVTLTDGQTWSFYLPAEQGSYEERRVFKLDLLERTESESSEVLRRYLEQERLASGSALATARDEYRDRSRRSNARQAIPVAWREIVENGDEMLHELLADAVESKVGIRPDDADVATYLSGLTVPDGVPPVERLPLHKAASAGKTRSASPDVRSQSPRRGTGVLHGQEFKFATAKEAMVFVLSELAKVDATFLQRCASHPAFRGRKRRHVARRAEDIYPDRPDLQEYCEPLPGGWLVETNLNNPTKMRLIRGAAEVAGLRFGLDVIVEF